MGTAIPLFTGFQIPNSIRLSQLNLDAAIQDLEKARDDIRTQVAKAYVQILYDTEMSEMARRQTVIDSLQVARLRALLDNGKASQAELSQQQAALAQSRLTATQADNNRRLSLLALSQLLELPSPEHFDIERPKLSADSVLLSAGDALPSPEAIYQEALAFKPEVRAEQLRLQAAGHSVRIAQAGNYPTLTLNAGLQTNHFKTNGLPAEPFFTQIKNNFAQYVGLSLNYTLFNRMATRNSIRTARIDLENQRLALDNTRKTLYKEIQQVCYNTLAARAKLRSSAAALRSSEDAFALMLAKYENGKASVTEYDDAKNKRLKAESDLVQAHYEYLYQTALLHFYRGRELSL